MPPYSAFGLPHPVSAAPSSLNRLNRSADSAFSAGRQCRSMAKALDGSERLRPTLCESELVWGRRIAPTSKKFVIKKHKNFICIIFRDYKKLRIKRFPDRCHKKYRNNIRLGSSSLSSCNAWHGTCNLLAKGGRRSPPLHPRTSNFRLED